MDVYFESDHQAKLQSIPRTHPWTLNEYSPDGQYVDFKQFPDLIPHALEDLKSVKGTLVEQTVVDFISWANGDQSVFETNDFGLRPLKANQSGVSPSALELHGRVVLLFRDLKLNTSKSTVEEFSHRINYELTVCDPEFKQACWGCCTWPHQFLELADQGQPSEGVCFVFLVWAWGDTQDEVYENLDRAFRNLRSALEAAILPPSG